jgi:hypothetical protein
VRPRRVRGGAQGLHHEERVPPGLLKEATDRGGIEGVARQPRGERRGLLAGEPFERNLDELTVPGEGRQQRRQVGVVGSLVAAQRADQEEVRGALGPEQVAQPFQRVPIAPLEIVEEQHERPGRC